MNESLPFLVSKKWEAFIGVLVGAFYFQGISRELMNAAIGRFMNERPA